MSKKTKIKLRTGRLDLAEQEFIHKHHQMSTAEIANKLHRSVTSIARFRDAKGLRPASLDLSNYDPTIRPFWKNLQRQFTEDELEVFKYEWKRIIEQFKEDVLATEELQIQALITDGILMARNMEERKSATVQISRLEQQLNDIYKMNPTDRDIGWQEKVWSLEQQIAGLRASGKAMTDERAKLEAERSKYLRDLKATREQRIERATDGKVSWPHLLKQVEEIEFRDAEGRSAALLNMAASKEIERLSELHTYQDGEVDTPFLTPEIVEERAKMEEEEKLKEEKIDGAS